MPCISHLGLHFEGLVPGITPGTRSSPGESLSAGSLCLGEEVDGDNEPVQAQDLGEDEDQDHADEEPRLLRRPPHAGVAHDADGVARRQSRQAY